MKRATIEMAVGIFIVIGIACVGYLTIKLGKMELIGDNYYPLTARFQSVSGLTKGAQVEMAGVPVGKVGAIALDHERLVAIVSLRIQKGLVLTDDVIASVKTSGLIGDKFIKLSPGGSDVILKAGDMIIETESALDLEDLISKYAFGDAE